MSMKEIAYDFALGPFNIKTTHWYLRGPMLNIPGLDSLIMLQQLSQSPMKTLMVYFEDASSYDAASIDPEVRIYDQNRALLLERIKEKLANLVTVTPTFVDPRMAWLNWLDTNGQSAFPFVQHIFTISPHICLDKEEARKILQDEQRRLVAWLHQDTANQQRSRSIYHLPLKSVERLDWWIFFTLLYYQLYDTLWFVSTLDRFACWVLGWLSLGYVKLQSFRKASNEVFEERLRPSIVRLSYITKASETSRTILRDQEHHTNLVESYYKWNDILIHRESLPTLAMISINPKNWAFLGLGWAHIVSYCFIAYYLTWYLDIMRVVCIAAILGFKTLVGKYNVTPLVRVAELFVNVWVLNVLVWLSVCFLFYRALRRVYHQSTPLKNHALFWLSPILCVLFLMYSVLMQIISVPNLIV